VGHRQGGGLERTKDLTMSTVRTTAAGSEAAVSVVTLTQENSATQLQRHKAIVRVRIFSKMNRAPQAAAMTYLCELVRGLLTAD